jgi:hypothetical protein
MLRRGGWSNRRTSLTPVPPMSIAVPMLRPAGGQGIKNAPDQGSFFHLLLNGLKVRRLKGMRSAEISSGEGGDEMSRSNEIAVLSVACCDAARN